MEQIRSDVLPAHAIEVGQPADLVVFDWESGDDVRVVA